MTKRPRQPGALPRTGTELQHDLLVALNEAGWHTQMTRRSHMCRTEATPGFPDIFAIKDGVFWFIECKSRYEQLTIDQEGWYWAIFGKGRRPEVTDVIDSGPYPLLHAHMVRWTLARPAGLDLYLRAIKEEPGTWV